MQKGNRNTYAIGGDFSQGAVIGLGEGNIARFTGASAVFVDLALGAFITSDLGFAHFLVEGHVGAGQHAGGGEGRSHGQSNEDDESTEHLCFFIQNQMKVWLQSEKWTVLNRHQSNSIETKSKKKTIEFCNLLHW